MFGARIAELRKEQGLTQSELAKKVGISRSALSLYEIEKREPDIETFINLSVFFNVQVDYLMGKADRRTADEDLSWRYPPVSNRLGRILQKYRAEVKLSENQLASALDISAETYIGIETGKYLPSMTFLKKFSDVSGYGLDFLTGNDEATSRPAGNVVDFSGSPRASFIFEYDYHFKARLEELCIRDGVTDENSEQILGLSRSEFEDIKCNRMPTLSELLKIAYGFDVSLDYLVGRTDLPMLRLSDDELDLLLNYRDCLPQYKKHLSKRASDLCKESVLGESVAADPPLKQAK